MDQEILRVVYASKRAANANPKDPRAAQYLAYILDQFGDCNGALAAYRRAVRLAESNGIIHSDMCLAMACSDLVTPSEIFDEHLKWSQRHGDSPAYLPVDPSWLSRLMRVGYVSADFREHPRRRFLGPVLAYRDRSAIEIFCYSDTKKSDAATERFKSWSDHWRETSSLDDTMLTELIRNDKIDVLVDMTGHMGGNRLGVFARRAAPVQMLYPGYPGTTGLATMDYCLTDNLRDPPGSETYYTEKLLRIPGGSQCYDPIGNETQPMVPVVPPPVDRNGYITFACFNRLVKASPTAVELWAKALKALPTSRLLMLTAGKDRDHPLLSESFAKHGISRERFAFIPRRSRSDYLALHNEIDICLDTYPYHGHTTTLDALWMGVPTVSLMGSTRPARESRAMLSAVGLDDLAVDSDEQFVKSTVSLAANRTRLLHLRQTLRETMRQSSLMDGRRVAKTIEDACRYALSERSGAQMNSPPAPSNAKGVGSGESLGS